MAKLNFRDIISTDANNNQFMNNHDANYDYMKVGNKYYAKRKNAGNDEWFDISGDMEATNKLDQYLSNGGDDKHSLPVKKTHIKPKIQVKQNTSQTSLNNKDNNNSNATSKKDDNTKKNKESTKSTVVVATAGDKPVKLSYNGKPVKSTTDKKSTDTNKNNTQNTSQRNAETRKTLSTTKGSSSFDTMRQRFKENVLHNQSVGEELSQEISDIKRRFITPRNLVSDRYNPSSDSQQNITMSNPITRLAQPIRHNQNNSKKSVATTKGTSSNNSSKERSAKIAAARQAYNRAAQAELNKRVYKK